MSIRFKFPSIGRPEFAYAVNTEYDYSRSNGRPLWDHAYEFQTYGDGLTQHSHEYRVQVEQMADFCASFADFLLQPREAEERSRIQEACFSFPWRETYIKDLEFCFSVRYDEKKPHRWYSKRARKIAAKEPKVSLSEASEWAKIPEWADGSAPAIARMLIPDYEDEVLKIFRVHLDAYHYVMSQKDGPWSERPETACKLEREADRPFRIVCDIFRAWDSLNSAERGMENYRRNLENDKRRPAEAEAQAATATEPTEAAG